jgi:hypothetical protein
MAEKKSPDEESIMVFYFFGFITSLYAERRASINISFGTLLSSKVVAPFSPHLLGTG